MQYNFFLMNKVLLGVLIIIIATPMFATAADESDPEKLKEIKEASLAAHAAHREDLEKGTFLGQKPTDGHTIPEEVLKYYHICDEHCTHGNCSTRREHSAYCELFCKLPQSKNVEGCLKGKKEKFPDVHLVVTTAAPHEDQPTSKEPKQETPQQQEIPTQQDTQQKKVVQSKKEKEPEHETPIHEDIPQKKDPQSKKEKEPKLEVPIHEETPTKKVIQSKKEKEPELETPIHEDTPPKKGTPQKTKPKE